MRREFADWVAEFGRNNANLIFITGDLGYAALEDVQASLGLRFVNAGVSEQNMISLAAALAQQGLQPICYSIAPFAVFRPYEQIRLDVALHGLNVKIVGNGGGYGYGIMGASHHALEDLAALSCLPGFACFIPLCNEDVSAAGNALMGYPGPGYLRLGFGLWPKELPAPPAFADIRRLTPDRECPPRVTVVGMGPVILNMLPWVNSMMNVDVFAVGRLPLPNPLDESLCNSVRQSRRLLVVEEHARHGGLASHLMPSLAATGESCTLHHSAALGYPSGLYGSQAYHQRESGLDGNCLKLTLEQLLALK
jgi:transketolase